MDNQIFNSPTGGEGINAHFIDVANESESMEVVFYQ